VWSFRLTDRNGVAIAEVLNASERKAKIGIKQLDTASFKMRADNPLLLNLFTEDTLLQVWQDQSIRFWGPVITPEFASNENEEDSVAINAVSPVWQLSKRLAGKSPTGTPYNGWDKGAVVQNMIETTNAVSGTYIEPPSFAMRTETLVNYTAGPYKPILTCIRDLSGGFDGFDWRFTPFASMHEPSLLGQFELANILGELRPDTVFEYGCGRHNMRGMTYKRDLTNILNDAYHLTDAGAADPAGVVEKFDAESIAAHFRMEGVIESGGLTDISLREQWAQENVNVRKAPRLIATMTSDLVDESGRAPKPWTDYVPGDFVQMRAAKNGVQLFDAYARCYAIEVQVDQNGQATYIPTLVEEEGTGGEES
jgi:hypothetical protein